MAKKYGKSVKPSSHKKEDLFDDTENDGLTVGNQLLRNDDDNDEIQTHLH